MSVIVSRALPDARDGLKPSQRRILVAMNDLHLGPASHRIKCAKISGDTSGNYHPHGESVIYPTLVRLAQPWVMRDVLIDKQGNFGSLAGLPPAAMRYTEARLSAVAVRDARRPRATTPSISSTITTSAAAKSRSSCRRGFPTCSSTARAALPSAWRRAFRRTISTKSPTRSIKIIDDPDCTIDDMLEVMPGPGFSDRRHHLRPRRDSAGLSDRPLDDHAAGRHAFRDRKELRRDRRHRDSLSRNARPPQGKAGRPDSRRPDQGHRPRRRFHGPQDARVAGAAAHRAQARRRPRSRARISFSSIRRCRSPSA